MLWFSLEIRSRCDVMKRLGLLVLLFAAAWPQPAAPQSAEFIRIGRDAFAFHEDLFREHEIKVEPHAVIDVEVFIELIGIPNADKINALRLQIRRSFGLGNAAAMYRGGFRSIVYDPNWARTSSAEFYLALGHEAGHLICEHDFRKISPQERELEADRFAGASVKRFEVYHGRSFLGAVLSVAATKYPESGSPSHPSRHARIDAIRRGYEEGSPCGNLAPPVRGLSRGTR